MDHLFFKTPLAAVPVSQCLFIYQETVLFWYTVSYKKIEKSDLVWLKVTTDVTTSDYEHLWTRIRVTKRDYWWLWVTSSDNDGPEFEWLQVIKSNYNTRLPYLWPYLASEFHSKTSYSTLSFDNNWGGSFEEILKNCWN